jgi:hypothetical protein
MQMLWKVGIAGAGALAGLYLVDTFVLRESDDSKSGFITRAPGFGLDDVVMGLGIGLTVVLALKVSGHGG